MYRQTASAGSLYNNNYTLAHGYVYLRWYVGTYMCNTIIYTHRSGRRVGVQMSAGYRVARGVRARIYICIYICRIRRTVYNDITIIIITPLSPTRPGIRRARTTRVVPERK